MQVAHKTNLPERARYYQGMMDEAELKPEEDFDKLKTSYVLFICLFDPFKANLPIYTFQNRCDEKPELLLNDRSYKVFYNCKGWESVEDAEIKAIYQLILNNQASTDFTEEIRRQMHYARHNVQYRQGYMTLARMRAQDKAEGITIGEERGRAEGSRTKALEAARNLLAMHVLTNEQIAQATGLSAEEIAQL